MQIGKAAICKIVCVVIFVANRHSQIEDGRCRKESRIWRKQCPVPSLEFAIKLFKLKQIDPCSDDCWEWADDGIHEPPQLHMIARLNFLCVDEIAPVKACVLKSVDKGL